MVCMGSYSKLSMGEFLKKPHIADGGHHPVIFPRFAGVFKGIPNSRWSSEVTSLRGRLAFGIVCSRPGV